ncbi:hypothetical protein FD33_GL000082 [Companilactobacillus paralimentarius DSM 13238 = JCM 10415]|jgi:hypothetical protein|uniref:Uncharacterized protein n=1 Tax=Companilactobacillus paralimentarius DSM 13238 = JCM 10415 TaxID=1122151 RepID=A0A0R1PQ87_9LACO|nr:hypothetical protein [Companilactobacillus paralimentarius]KAE9565638.1 hypothetical protein ATN96_02395 [Companilactobacillus paralimentarius]KRL30712.1 hypothetical protein FD33_GL000082 [Companilactobacillus paralimentarius DSM 13238 = JCM 10415]MDR4933314.1 hypothetical protein [Companilactobacillus paralimentarius]
MSVDNLRDLKKLVQSKGDGFEVTGSAFEFCDQVHQAQVFGSGSDWSIAATNGWMALVTGFNHKIHRLFMSQDKKEREDLQHLISTQYVIKKTEQAEKYQLILKK